MYALVLGLLGVLFFSGCNKDNLPKYVELGKLRILAFQTSTPEVTFGDSVVVKHQRY